MLSLKVEATAGTEIDQACRQIQDLADRLVLNIELTFNDVTCIAVPGGSASLLAERQQEQQADTVGKYKFASSRA